MKIRHQESNFVYEITEVKGTYRLVDFHTNKTYSFKESYDALWQAIELVRNISLELLTIEGLDGIIKRSHLSLDTIPKSLLSQIKRERVIRTYYDHVFLKLLSNYRIGTSEIELSHKTNFTVEYEVAYILRQAVGATLSLPTIPA